MKVSLKNDKWVFQFKTVKINCFITNINDIYTILFKLNDKIVKIKTCDLDSTFSNLEKTFDNQSTFNYR